MKQVDAPNVIIAPQHQSAPKEPERFVPSYNQAKKSKQQAAPWDSYDREMDLPEYTDPQVMRDLEQLQQRRVKPSEAMIEEAEFQHERNANDERVKQSRWQGQHRWQGKENEAMRMVNIIHCDEFIRRLQKAGVSAALSNPIVDEWLREQKHNIERANLNHDEFKIVGTGGARIWLNNFSRAGRIGVNVWTKPEPGTAEYERGDYICQTLTSLQYPYGPEYSLMRFDEYNVPTNERFRGWRTVLLTLILNDIITEAQADKAFGPAYGPASLFYRQQLFDHRKVQMGLVF